MRTLPRSTPAVVLGVAILMLLTTTGGAVAGSLITSKQIKDNTITSADIKNKTITKADLAPSTQGLQGIQGIQGVQGVQGVAGDAGQAGPRGFSAWDTIPSGVTVTGNVNIDTLNPGVAETDSYWVSLPGQAPANLSNATINFAPNAAASDDDPTCTGSASAPTAPAGKVCLYFGSGVQVSQMQGVLGGLPKAGFSIMWLPSAVANSDLFFQVSWAYTAP